ncbi:hypothetical protein [Vulcanisaeta distributa]|nr:hypothetical protein [Vulcanisaeta distributa]
MVTCGLYDLKRILSNVRVRVINCVMEQKRVKARDLGVTLNFYFDYSL